MESIIEMFSGLNTQTRADILTRLSTKNSELISAKRNNSHNVDILSLPPQNNEIQNQNNQSQDQSNLLQPPLALNTGTSDTGNTNNRRNRYKDELKQYAVNRWLELNNYAKAGVETQTQHSLSKAIDESSVRDWVASLKFCTQEQIEKTQKKKQIRDSNSTIPGLDARIRDYIIEQRKKKIAVNFKMIKTEAKKFFPDPDFKASPGWWRNVRRRLKISLRVATHFIQ